MDYKLIYENLIQKRRDNPIETGYKENHHIVMKSMGGSDDKSNIIVLTAREHYIAHLLLHRIHHRKETACAVWMMQCKSETNERNYIINSRMYEWARKEFSKYIGNRYSIAVSNGSVSLEMALKALNLKFQQTYHQYHLLYQVIFLMTQYDM